MAQRTETSYTKGLSGENLERQSQNFSLQDQRQSPNLDEGHYHQQQQLQASEKNLTQQLVEQQQFEIEQQKRLQQKY